MNARELAKHIEHAVLAPQATEQEVEEAARTAMRWGVRALLVKPCHLPLAARLLEGSGVMAVTVIGFPHGAHTAETKTYETKQAIASGAHEIDMVLNIGALRANDTAAVFSEIRAVVEAAAGRPVKVILETAYLNDTEKQLACRLASRAGAGFVKTSTGFGPKGATVDDVRLLRRTVRRPVGVKAAGGIRSYADAMALLQAGADLLGTSSTDAILAEAEAVAA